MSVLTVLLVLLAVTGRAKSGTSHDLGALGVRRHDNRRKDRGGGWASINPATNFEALSVQHCFTSEWFHRSTFVPAT